MALYRTYRPSRFEDVIGQEAVVEALRGGLSSGKTSHALMLTGPRGTGKTTLARILAKGLNCEIGPTDTPCNQCDSCTSINNGSSSDVFELDAASNRGVDDARALRDRLSMSPVAGRKHIFIIDEAHMLTREAQNALLKSLEEPPEAVHFVFCTTAPQKLLDTVRSRCHHFALHRGTPKELARTAMRAAESEGIDISEEAINLVVQAGNGSFRDTLSILDQLQLSSSHIEMRDVEQLLGRPRDTVLASIIEAISLQRGDDVLNQIRKLSEEGYDIEACVHGLSQYLRLVVYAQQLGKIPEYLTEDREIIEQAQSIGQRISSAHILHLIEGLDTARQQHARGLPLDMALEVACLQTMQDIHSTPEAVVPAPQLSQEPISPAASPSLADDKHDAFETLGDLPPLPSRLTLAQAVSSFPVLKLWFRGEKPDQKSADHTDLYLLLRTARCEVDNETLRIYIPRPASEGQQAICTELFRRLGIEEVSLIGPEDTQVSSSHHSQPESSSPTEYSTSEDDDLLDLSDLGLEELSS